MNYSPEARPRRPQLGVRYGLGVEMTQPTSRAAVRNISGMRALPEGSVRPRSVASMLEPSASPWFYSRSAATLWIAIGVITAFVTTWVGMAMLIGHELRRSVAAEFMVGLVETAASISLGLAMWSRVSPRLRVATPVLIASVGFGALLVLTGAMTIWGTLVAVLAAVAAIFSLVILGEQLKADRAGSSLEFEEDEYADDTSDEQGVALA